jgi:hypothetical protein
MTPEQMLGHGWKVSHDSIYQQGKEVVAPCGCHGRPFSLTPLPNGVVRIPMQGELKFSEFSDCGKPSHICVFQNKSRALAFRTDIPTNDEVWAFFEMFGS